MEEVSFVLKEKIEREKDQAGVKSGQNSGMELSSFFGSCYTFHSKYGREDEK